MFKEYVESIIYKDKTVKFNHLKFAYSLVYATYTRKLLILYFFTPKIHIIIQEIFMFKIKLKGQKQFIQYVVDRGIIIIKNTLFFKPFQDLKTN